MSDESIERKKQIVLAYEQYGFDYVRKEFGIRWEDTVRRYKDMLKSHGISIPKIERKEVGKDLNVFVFDIETSRAKFNLFRTGKQYVSANNIESESFIICWSGAWIDVKTGAVKERFGYVLSPDESIHRNDEKAVLSLHSELMKADVVIGHNVSVFDLPIVQKKIALLGLKTLPPFEIYDTLLSARKFGRFDSYSLDFLVKTFGLGQKISTSMELWELCEAGDTEALQDMFTYCKHDVLLTGLLYFVLRGRSKCRHPNLALYVDEPELCPICLNAEFEEVSEYKTHVNKYVAFRCKNCGAIKRSRKKLDIISQEFTLTAK